MSKSNFGTLEGLLKRRKSLTKLEIQCYIIQIFKSLKYLKPHNIIYGNL